MTAPQFLRTSSFRLTMLYAALFGSSVLVLFGVMFWFGTGFVAGQIDRTVADELTEIRNDAAGEDITGLAQVVTSLSQHAAPGTYYLLQDAKGRFLAGNIPAMKLTLGVFSWDPPSKLKTLGVEHSGARGQGLLLEHGTYLLVGVSDHELNEMQEMVTRSFLWVLAGTILLALGGGVLMSVSTLRRLEAISRTTREIVNGDLSRRIVIRGTDDEFDHLGASLNTMLDRIEGLMEGLRQVSNDIAHDLRTPVTRLRQRLELERRKGTSVHALQNAIDGSITDLDSILDTFGALLRIAQIEAHTRSAAFAALDPGLVLATVVDAYQPVAEEKGQSLRASIEPDLRIRGDRELLPQIFSNLIENAIAHSPPGTTITITAESHPQHVEITIADNGPGIPAAYRAKVFQRFFRLEQSRSTPGTGLGLSLALAIVNLHDARLALSDNYPGLHVSIVFPHMPGNATL